MLPTGVFANYKGQRQAEGVALVHLKPPHINPSDKMLSLLGIELGAVSEAGVGVGAEVLIGR